MSLNEAEGDVQQLLYELDRRLNDESDYFVIHVGRGTDGGFGDYSPPYWSEKPVEVDGRTIWFTDESDANAATAALNNASRESFYGAGHGPQYSGDFPVEYEVRRITPPKGNACLLDEALMLVAMSHVDQWRTSSWGDYADEFCEACGDDGHVSCPECE